MSRTISTKQRILQAAKRRFERGDSGEFSIRELAKDVKLTPMALYRHFADKSALMDAISADALDEWRSRLEAIEARNAIEWIERMSRAFLDFSIEAPRRFDAAFLLPAPNARQFPQDIEAGRSPALNLIIAHIEEAQHSGALMSRMSAAEIAMAIWALAQGLVTLHRANRFAGTIDEFRRVYDKAVLHYLDSFKEKNTK